MCSEATVSSKRATHLNLSTVTPNFPIFKEIVNFTRGGCPSVLVADELSPEGHFKLLSQDNLLLDRLSLVSNESVSSVSETEKDRPPIDQDEICAQLSDWLIHSFEERHWLQLTEGIDFRDEVDPVQHLGTVSPSKSCDRQPIGHSRSPSSDFHLHEGNSVFYAICNEDASQRATTSSHNDGLSAICGPSLSSRPESSSIMARRRRSSESQTREKIGWEGHSMRRANSIQQLISAIADNLSPSPKSLRRFEVLRTFNVLTLRVPLRKWRSLKKKFIFEHSKPIDFITQLTLQHNRCAGCGLKLDKFYAKRTLYCHYYAKLFCQCCHQGTKARIPALILHEWNFKEYPVSDIAHQFLLDNADQPVFNVRLISPGLYRRAKNLRKFRKLRIKISHMWPFVQMCKMAAEQMTENGLTMFSSVPMRFLALESVDIYSLLDLERIANKNLIELVEPLAQKGAVHIENCERCCQNAFLCQICMDPNDPLFPFQIERCYRCDSCGSLTHWKCYKKATNVQSENGEQVRCEKCERIRRKRFRLQRNASTDRSTCESD